MEEDMDKEQRDRLARLIQGIDITSADGRAGITSLLREIERIAPGVIESEVAAGQLARVRSAVR